jgi:hypothetical protein
LPKFLADAGHGPFTLSLSNLFRLHVAPCFILKSRIKLIRQEPPGQESVESLTRFAAAADSDAGGPMAQIDPASPEKVFLEVLFEALKRGKTVPQSSRFFI